MNLEQLKELMKLKLDSYGEGFFSDEDIPEELGCVSAEGGEWTQDGKYQYHTAVLKFDDKYFTIYNIRSGSYHSDWYYGVPYVSEVKPVTKVVTTTTWEAV